MIFEFGCFLLAFGFEFPIHFMIFKEISAGFEKSLVNSFRFFFILEIAHSFKLNIHDFPGIHNLSTTYFRIAITAWIIRRHIHHLVRMFRIPKWGCISEWVRLIAGGVAAWLRTILKSLGWSHSVLRILVVWVVEVRCLFFTHSTRWLAVVLFTYYMLASFLSQELLRLCFDRACISPHHLPFVLTRQIRGRCLLTVGRGGEKGLRYRPA